MDTLSIGICEDTADDRTRLGEAIAATSFPCSCDWFTSGEEFLESFARGKYDLVFLDVFMGGMTGVEVAKRVRAVDADVMAAFVTTSPEFTMEGYRSRVERYVLKPYRDEEIREVLESALQRVARLQELTVAIAGRSISYSHIRYAEQNNHTTTVYLRDGDEVRRTGRLDELEQALPSPPFYRCHKSYLVNLDYVHRLDRDLSMFEMNGGGSAYIRRASVAEARRVYERRLIERTKSLGERQ